MARATTAGNPHRRKLRAVEESHPAPGGPAAPARPRWEDLYPVTRVIADDGSAVGPLPPLPDAELLRLCRVMILSRELDERMVVLQRQGRIGFYVGAVGEEATIVGATAALEDQDWIFPCYREHAAALMRGLPLVAFAANVLGNDGDLARGRQMPCHETWRVGRFASISAPIATQIPHAVGAAWAARLRGDDAVALAWFGDGATSAGDFHVALNFAGVRKAPVIFACRNNGWAISTPREAQTASETIAQKAVAYGIHGERVDGNDLLAVHDATRRARARAAAGGGPTLLEFVTYRLEAHTTSDDPRAYRPEELVAPWRAKDPIPRLRRHLARRGLLSDAEHARIRDEVREEIRAALAEAEALPPKPPLESLFEDVYAAPLRQQREQLAELREAIAADPRVATPRRGD
ncbi:MAG TPA: thiamine pyrophosphate-dependent enzyme [Anaeromyxobacter sp.]